jgi:hypothetical protein
LKPYIELFTDFLQENYKEKLEDSLSLNKITVVHLSVDLAGFDNALIMVSKGKGVT